MSTKNTENTENVNAESPKKKGNRKTASGVIRDQTISVRVSADEHAVITARAVAEDRELGAMLRRMAFEDRQPNTIQTSLDH